MAIYILWPTDRKISVRITIPDSLSIHEIFNGECNPGTNFGELKFSRFVINGYLGITFKVQIIGNSSTPVNIGFVFEDESGMSEVHTKTVLLIPQGMRHIPTTSINIYPNTEVHEDKLVGVSISRTPRDYPSFETEEKYRIASILEKIFKKLDQISYDIEDEFKIEGRVLTVLFPESKLRFEQIIRLKKSRPLPKTVKFTHIIPSRVEIIQLTNLKPVPESVVYVDDGYKIKLNFLSPDESLLLSLEYCFDEVAKLPPLLQESCSLNVQMNPDPETIRFDISVQVKYPDLLTRNGCTVNFRDLQIELEILFNQKPLSDASDEAKIKNAVILPLGDKSMHAQCGAIISESSKEKICVIIRRDFTYNTASLTCGISERSTIQPQSQKLKLFLRTDLPFGKPAEDVSIVLNGRFPIK